LSRRLRKGLVEFGVTLDHGLRSLLAELSTSVSQEGSHRRQASVVIVTAGEPPGMLVRT